VSGHETKAGIIIETTCVIPRFDGAILAQEWKEALQDRFVIGAP